MTRFSVKLSNVLGLSFYRYELTSSNNNPNIDDEITITCHCTDPFGNNIKGKTLTLHHNEYDIGDATTNNDGIATWENIQVTTWGINDFKVSNTHLPILVDGWRTLNGSLESTWALQRNKNNARLLLMGWSASASSNFTNFGSGTYASTVRPKGTIYGRGDKDNIDFTIKNSGTIEYRNTGTTRNVYMQLEWSIRDEDR